MADINLFPEDICLRIKQLFSEPAITVPDADKNDNQVMSVVKPHYIKPETEIVVSEYPSLVFYEASVYADPARAHQGNKIADNQVYDALGNLLSLDLRSEPSPHVVLIDIRSYTIYDQQRDIIRKEVFRRLNLENGKGGISVKGYPIPIVLRGESALVGANSPDTDESNTQRRRGTQWRFSAYTRFDIAARTSYYVVRDVFTAVT